MAFKCDWCRKQFAQRGGLHHHLNRKPVSITFVNASNDGTLFDFDTCPDEMFLNIRQRLRDNDTLMDHRRLTLGMRLILDEDTPKRLRLKPGAQVRVWFDD